MMTFIWIAILGPAGWIPQKTATTEKDASRVQVDIRHIFVVLWFESYMIINDLEPIFNPYLL